MLIGQAVKATGVACPAFHTRLPRYAVGFRRIFPVAGSKSLMVNLLIVPNRCKIGPAKYQAMLAWSI